MNVLASECSAGHDCESGWTLYLEQSFLSPNNNNATHRGRSKFIDKGKNVKEKHDHEEEEEEEEDNDDEEEEEDLSMVSDASSGPPHFNEDEGYFNYDTGCFYPAPFTCKDTTLVINNGGKRHKMKQHHRCCKDQDQERPSFLDDTASSPAYDFPKNNFSLANNQASMENVLDYSQGFSATHFEGSQDHHIAYIQPSLSGNQIQNNPFKWIQDKRILEEI